MKEFFRFFVSDGARATALTIVAGSLLSGLPGCASRVSLDEKPAVADAPAGKVYYASSTPETSPDASSDSPDAGLWKAPVAVAYSLNGTPSIAGGPPPITETSPTGVSGTPGNGQPALASKKASYEFSQKLDENWVVTQSIRYGRPDNQPDVNWIDAGREPGEGLAYSDPGLGTFDVGSQVQAKFNTVGLQHQVKVGFDYVRSRDIFDNRIGPAPSLDIFDPQYGTSLNTPMMVASAYSERSTMGFYTQDEVKLNHWVLTLVGRRDQLSNRTIDLGVRDAADTLQDDQTISGRAGLKYQFDNGLAPYVNYSETLAPAGATVLAATTSQQYETGVKYQPLGLGKLMTLSAFNQIQNNSQAGGDAEAGCALATCSAWAELRIRGATVESRLQPVAGLDLVASYAVTNSEVADASADAYGAMLANRFPSVSQQQVALTAKYKVSRGSFAGLSLDGRVGHTGANYYGGDSELPVSYVLVDAGINYDFSQLSSNLKGLMLRASANNMFDRNYWTYCYVTSCAAGTGRSVSAMLNYQLMLP